MTKGLIIVQIIALFVSFSNKVCFVGLNGTVHMKLDLEDPTRINQVNTKNRRDKPLSTIRL
jgi:hypothetical protein